MYLTSRHAEVTLYYPEFPECQEIKCMRKQWIPGPLLRFFERPGTRLSPEWTFIWQVQRCPQCQYLVQHFGIRDPSQAVVKFSHLYIPNVYQHAIMHLSGDISVVPRPPCFHSLVASRKQKKHEKQGRPGNTYYMNNVRWTQGGRRDRWMGGWMDGWMGGWVDGWMDGWMDG